MQSGEGKRPRKRGVKSKYKEREKSVSFFFSERDTKRNVFIEREGDR